MHVRLARPTDAPLLLALALDDDSHIIQGSDRPGSNPVFRTLLRSALPFALPSRAWIVRDGAEAALLEAQPRRYVIGWDITRLALRGSPEDLLGPLMQGVMEHLQNRSVPRLFARCVEEQADLLSRTVGFHTLAREYVLGGTKKEVGREETLPIESRYRMPEDAWPLHQFEREVTPSLIGQLEGLTSSDWSRHREMAQIVVEREGRIVGWIGWRPKPRRGFHDVAMLIHPDHRELAQPLLDHALAQLPSGSQIYARVRAYQVEALRAFQDAGFEVIREEILMVKHGEVQYAKAEKRLLRGVAGVPTAHAFRLHPEPRSGWTDQRVS